MKRYIAFSIALVPGFLAGCGRSERTVLLNWAADTPLSGDSVARAFAQVLGESPDSLERCGNKRLRISLVNRPGAFPVVSERTGNTIVQSGPGPDIERNLVRSVAYASNDLFETFGIDTLIVTLTRTSRDGGSQRSSYQVTRRDMLGGSDFLSSYSVPVSAVSLKEEPCGTTAR